MLFASPAKLAVNDAVPVLVGVMLQLPEYGGDVPVSEIEHCSLISAPSVQVTVIALAPGRWLPFEAKLTVTVVGEPTVAGSGDTLLMVNVEVAFSTVWLSGVPSEDAA